MVLSGKCEKGEQHCRPISSLSSTEILAHEGKYDTLPSAMIVSDNTSNDGSLDKVNF